MAARTTPFFSERQNISGQAGISGNNQEPVNWGPPGLSFASGISALSDSKWVAVNTIIEEAVVRQILPKLKAAKAQGIVEYPLNKIVL